MSAPDTARVYDPSRLIAVDVGCRFIDQTVAAAKALAAKTDLEVQVIFPNRRAVRFFNHALGIPLSLRIAAMSGSDLMRNIVFANLNPVPLLLQDIDRYFLLLDLMKNRLPDLYTKLGGDPDPVFPWCIRLAGLLDELDMNLVDSVSDFEYVEETVPEAVEILSRLDRIVQAYRNELATKNFTADGDIYRRAVSLADGLEAPFIIAGFGALTVSEQRFFRSLFQRGDTEVLFQTDLKKRHEAFHPYRIFQPWMSGKFWGIKPETVECESPDPAEKSCRFFESFDIHSQVGQLHTMLSDEPGRFENTPTDAAVVVPGTASLIPALQVIPQKKLNVTAGYPFNKTGFFRLMNSLMELELKTGGNGFLYISVVLKIMSNPLVRPLLVETGRPDGESTPEHILIQNGKNLMTESEISLLLQQEGFAGAEDFFKNVVFPFIKVRSLSAIGKVLEKLALDIMKAMPDTGKEGPEKRMLRNFIEQVLPRFNNSRYRETRFSSPRILFMLIRHLAAAISVRFEGNPLEGLQVMGFLESRMLSFEHIFVLDVNEGTLPTETPPDPLLPTGLRPALGLPGPKQREMVHDYHFFRLIDSARNVSLFYRKGETSDRKSIRSRYIEQLFFEAEKKQYSENGKLEIQRFEKEKIQSVALHLVPFTRTGTHNLTNADIDTLQFYFKNGISASFLDELLQCPHRFYLRRVLKLPEEVILQEGQDPRDVGTLVHEALENGFRIGKGKLLTFELLKIIENETMKEVNRLLSDKLKNLSPTHLELLLFLSEKRLEAYFSLMKKEIRQKEITVLALEEELAATLGNVKLTGYIDRLDKVKDKKTGEEEWHVVDYKTGSYATVPAKKGWNDFLAQDMGEDTLDKLSAKLHSIQLPIYSYLVSQNRGVSFDEVTSELFLLGKGKAENFNGKDLGEENFRKIIESLLNMLQPGAAMPPTENHDHCKWCPYAKTCRFSVHSV
ncbi:MAG: hypothetical protein CO090_07020 [Acidobacteria bacterium CG_4_9_14_3_um_filter_49_7]|nr:MAG: hypothetical protein CO090_07020 [Acidobacteria bacterium CG_4_9_14_3_um_filter_49_7]